MSLSPRQTRLSESLFDYNNSLGKMYLGGLHAFSDSANPDRIAQSAHSFRELIEKAPRYINAPQEVKEQKAGYSLEPKVLEFQKAWTKVQESSDCYNSNSGWSGKIDPPLTSFLEHLCQFFKEFAEKPPTRRQNVAELLQRTDPSNEALPRSVEGLITKRWVSLYRTFTNICHHQYSPEIPKFERYIERLEEILIAVLIPQTVSDHEAIKREIAILEGQ